MDSQLSDVKATVHFNKGYLEVHHAGSLTETQFCTAMTNHDSRQFSYHSSGVYPKLLGCP